MDIEVNLKGNLIIINNFMNYNKKQNTKNESICCNIFSEYSSEFKFPKKIYTNKIQNFIPALIIFLFKTVNIVKFLLI